jgi:hypothetical protein
VRVVDDPYVLLRILEDLGKDVPLNAPMYKSLTFLQEKALRKILTLPLPPDLESKMKELATKRLIDKGMDRQMIRNLGPQLLKASAKEVQAKLHSTNSAVRLVAIAVIVQRRLPLEEDLIAMLEDPDRDVSGTNRAVHNTVHQALVRLARGTDFGPRTRTSRHDPKLSPRQMSRIVGKWRLWLELQRTAQAEMAAHAPPRRDVTPAAREARPGAELLASSLGMELVQSRVPQQQSALRQLHEGEGRVYTDALARAIPDLSSPIQDKARAALAERLTHWRPSCSPRHSAMIAPRCAAPPPARACSAKTPIVSPN